MDLWVVGGRGLLGSALRRTAPGQVFTAATPWRSPDVVAALTTQLQQFHRWRRPGAAWAIAWAAGTSVPASSPRHINAENQVLVQFARQVATSPGRGTFWFASTGSVFLPDSHQVFDETSHPEPQTAYAEAKLAQEADLASLFSSSPTVRLLIARLSTLYGPGQDPFKPQGLITKMCMEAILRGIITVSVPISTARDYLYVDDAARMAHHMLTTTWRAPNPHPLRILANGEPVSIGALARCVYEVIHKRTHLALAGPAHWDAHKTVFALRSQDPALAAIPRTPLAAGINNVRLDLLRRLQRGELARTGH